MSARLGKAEKSTLEAWDDEEDDEGGGNDDARLLTSMFDDDDSIMDLLSEKGEDDGEIEEEEKAVVVESEVKTKEEEGKKATKENGKGATTGAKDSLPLVVAPRLEDGLVLVQGDENVDLSGDVGAVGRVKITDETLYLDLKGAMYRADTYECDTMAVVAVGDEEARVTATLDEAVVLTCVKDMFASSEIVVQGELDRVDDDDDASGGASGGAAADPEAGAEGAEKLPPASTQTKRPGRKPKRPAAGSTRGAKAGVARIAKSPRKPKARKRD